MPPMLTIMSGIGCSGKTFISRAMGANDKSVFIYDPDEYALDQAYYNHQDYMEAKEEYIKSAIVYNDELLLEAIKNNMHVVWDENNLFASKRKWIIDKFPTNYAIQGISISPPDTEHEWIIINNRNYNREIPKYIPSYLLEYSASIFQPMTLNEGFARIMHMTLGGKLLKVEQREAKDF